MCTKTVVLDWETASAQNYTIDGSSNASTWTNLATKTGMTSYNHRIDSISGLTGTYRYVRMNGTTRTTGYGYSIWEFRVYGTSSGGGGGGGTACTTNVEAESYSSMSGVQTESGGSGTAVGWFDHNDWMKYSNINVTGMTSLLMSIAATTTGNVLEGHLDATTGPLFFTFSTTSTGGWTTYTPQSGTITPATGTHDIYIVGITNTNGICNIDWFKLIGSGSAGTTYSDTVTTGKYKVIRTITMGAANCFNLATKAYDSLAKWGVVFETPLKQYIERGGGALVNPYGDTANVPVTLYDFHSDRSNPEFEQPHTGGLHTGMVQDTLDKDRKPVLGPHPHNNNYIKYWFRSWYGVGGGKGDSTIPICSYTTLPYVTKHIPILRWMIPAVPLAWGASYCSGPANGGGQTGVGEINAPVNFVAIDTVHTDTAFKNVMIQDTLAFWQVAGNPGVYEYQDSNFYPLQNRGFGAEWNEEHNVEGLGCVNNYSFSMEMHRTFVMVPGLYFHFAGDDDLWVFINNKLALDLGGLHNTWTGEVDLDNLTGLTNFNVYNIDVFYCERHSCSSDILITTNMLVYKPITTKQRSWQRDYGNLN